MAPEGLPLAPLGEKLKKDMLKIVYKSLASRISFTSENHLGNLKALGGMEFGRSIYFRAKEKGLLKRVLTETRVEGRKTRVKTAMARISKLSLRAARLIRRVL